MAKDIESREHHERLKRLLLATGKAPTNNYALDYAIITIAWVDDEEQETIDMFVRELQRIGDQLEASQ